MQSFQNFATYLIQPNERVTFQLPSLESTIKIFFISEEHLHWNPQSRYFLSVKNFVICIPHRILLG